MITVVVSGNGTAYVNNPNPVQDEWFTLYSTPYEGESLEDIVPYTQQGQVIAITPDEEVSLQYQEFWGDVTIYVTFSSTPVPPTPTQRKRHKMPIWEYPMFRTR